ncbi:MAG: cobalamin biosynthetic protein CobC [Octadecabacter sp.]
MNKTRDHGGGLDAAILTFGGTRSDWLDLSTGINPVAYPIGEISTDAWTALPDYTAMEKLLTAARHFWNVPDGAEIVAAGGVSALIAAMPIVFAGARVTIPTPTYNEHAAAFIAHDWKVQQVGPSDVHVLVHPNNPDGKIWQAKDVRGPAIIDESFCDVMPKESLIAKADLTNCIVLKSFGKFWGLAGVRLGFAICSPALAQRLRDYLGPWAVSGPALEVGAQALTDMVWANATRKRLAADVAQLDKVVGLPVVGGTDLFRLYEVANAAAAQEYLASGHVWSRIFPYSTTWLRLGLPHPDRWDQLDLSIAGLR